MKGFMPSSSHNQPRVAEEPDADWCRQPQVYQPSRPLPRLPVAPPLKGRHELHRLLPDAEEVALDGGGMLGTVPTEWRAESCMVPVGSNQGMSVLSPLHTSCP